MGISLSGGVSSAACDAGRELREEAAQCVTVIGHSGVHQDTSGTCFLLGPVAHRWEFLMAHSDMIAAHMSPPCGAVVVSLLVPQSHRGGWGVQRGHNLLLRELWWEGG